MRQGGAFFVEKSRYSLSRRSGAVEVEEKNGISGRLGPSGRRVRPDYLFDHSEVLVCTPARAISPVGR